MKRPLTPLLAAAALASPAPVRAEAVFTTLWRQIGARAGDADPALFGVAGPGPFSRTAERQWTDPAGARNWGRAQQASFIDAGSIIASGRQDGFAELLGGEPGFGAGTDWIQADISAQSPTPFELAFTVTEIGAAAPDLLQLSLSNGSEALLAYDTSAGPLAGRFEERLVLTPGSYQLRWMIQRGATGSIPLERGGTYELIVRIPAPGPPGLVITMGPLLVRRRL